MIVLLGAILRIYSLDNMPLSLFSVNVDLEGFTLFDSVKYPSGEMVFLLLTKNE